MKSFLKKNRLWLSLLGIAVFMVILAFIFRPKPIHYQMNANESLNLINNESVQVSIQNLSGKQLIDIRSAELYAQGHPELAINIPVRQLLDEESVELFDRLLINKQEAVLYGSDELQAAAPVLLLQQLGYSNVKLLKGGITETGEFKVSEPAATEVSVIDTTAMHVKSEVKKTSEIAPAKKKAETVIPIRKEATSGGGC